MEILTLVDLETLHSFLNAELVLLVLAILGNLSLKLNDHPLRRRKMLVATVNVLFFGIVLGAWFMYFAPQNHGIIITTIWGCGLFIFSLPIVGFFLEYFLLPILANVNEIAKEEEWQNLKREILSNRTDLKERQLEMNRHKYERQFH